MSSGSIKFVPLDSLCRKVTVGHVGTTAKHYRDEGVPFLRTQNVGADTIKLEDLKFITEDFHKSQKKSQVRAGDILVSRVVTDRVNCGVVPPDIGEANCANVLLVRPCEDTVDTSYLHHYLRSPLAQGHLLGQRVGAAQQVVNTKVLRDLPIPLPPLEEQKRIAGILDQAAELCRLRTRALDKLNTLGQAIFHEMFEQQNCREEMLKNLGRVQTGSTPSTKVPEYFDGEIPFVTPGDLESDRVPERHLSATGADKSRTVPAGATLVCCIGATIGKVGMSTELSAFNQQINAIEWSEQVLPAFGFYAMRQIKPEIVHRGKGAATTLPILKKSEFEKLKVRVAPLDQQKVFMDRIEAIKPLATKAENARENSETLFASLQHRAFRGEL